MQNGKQDPGSGEAPPKDPGATTGPGLNLEDSLGLVNLGRRLQGDGTVPPLVNDHHRYQQHRELGAGGVGKVLSCRDPHLGREVALKTLHADLVDNVTQRSRFIREARVMAQLEHPHIVPIHELGMGETGEIYFTMKRVKGRSLQEIFQGLDDDDPELSAVYDCDYLLDLFIQVCQAIAFAHNRGVLHRDLKPANILIGDFGEALIMDWGLAKLLDESDSVIPGRDNLQPAAGALNNDDITVTMDGAVSGTPVYMSPEQALGKNSKLDERSDVYSLGTILYEILTGHHTVYGFNVEDTLERVINHEIIPPRKRERKRCISRELDAICMKALEKKPADRYRSVTDFIRDLQNARRGLPVAARPDSLLRKAWKWCKRHPLISSTSAAALTVLIAGLSLYGISSFIRYQELMRTGDRHRKKGNLLFNQKLDAYRALVEMRRQLTSKTKSPRETALDARLYALHQQSENEYDTAVILYMMSCDNLDNERRREAMRDIFGNRLDYSLMSQNWPEVERWLDFARNWLGENFEEADPVSRARFLDIIEKARGTGQLTLNVKPAGVPVTLWQFDPAEAGPRFPINPRPLGPAPVGPMALEKGSYLLTLDVKNSPSVRYPVYIEHGENEHAHINLPPVVPDGLVFIPGGRFLAGGENARNLRLHQASIPDFFIQAREVTFGEYLAFWVDPAGAHRSRDHISRVRFSREDRAFQDAWDAGGQLIAPLAPHLPVVGIKQASAAKYCEWLSVKSGKTYRLPTAYEWEKAARGVDGRDFVWGNTYRPEYAFTMENETARRQYAYWAPPGSFPIDRSIYGAYDMGGNVREWTASKFPDSPYYQIKGSSASLTKRFLYCAYSSDTPVVPSDVGFRAVMEP